jgi:hypothetical protein
MNGSMYVETGRLSHGDFAALMDGGGEAIFDRPRTLDFSRENETKGIESLNQ